MELLKKVDCTTFAYDQAACLRSNCCGWCLSEVETGNNTFDPFATPSTEYGGSITKFL